MLTTHLADNVEHHEYDGVPHRATRAVVKEIVQPRHRRNNGAVELGRNLYQHVELALEEHTAQLSIRKQNNVRRHQDRPR